MLHRRPFALALLALALAACERSITDPAPARPRPSLFIEPVPGDVFAVDLGVLPGDARSEATYVTSDGSAVYGYSYAVLFGDGPRRSFRWTASTGMQEVASIPAPAPYPLPTIPLTGDVGGILPRQANAKGEATGVFCRVFLDGGSEGEYGCPTDPSRPPFDFDERAFRYSRGGGIQDLDPRVPTEAGDEVNRAFGLGINKWGHVAGFFQPRLSDEWRAMLWTPLDSLREVGAFLNYVPREPYYDPRLVMINDNDRVLFTTYGGEDVATAYEPGHARRRLFPPSGSRTSDFLTVPLAQNNGAHVVGWSSYGYPTGTVKESGEPVYERRERAVRWTLPIPSRAAFPKVNANPYGGTGSTVSLSTNGGRYFQTYTATQTAAAGPYVEHVDWGDGTGSRRSRSSISAMAAVSHVYTKRGTFYVRVYVKDAQGRWGVSERKVTVVS